MAGFKLYLFLTLTLLFDWHQIMLLLGVSFCYVDINQWGHYVSNHSTLLYLLKRGRERVLLVYFTFFEHLNTLYKCTNNTSCSRQVNVHSSWTPSVYLNLKWWFKWYDI